MEHSHDPARKDPADLLALIRYICGRFRITSLDRQFDACKRLFVENPLIDIAILGQFKAGKSSFINSFIGQPILPVGVIPVTTVITRLQYGVRERAVVSFFDGTKTEVVFDETEEYISEAKNKANEKNVEVVDVELPSLEPYRGLRFVDTPGLGSIFKYNTALSQEWLPEVGTAIVAISADRPLSENDLNLIQELMGYTPNVVLLLTKVDLLNDSQQGEMINFMKSSLKKEFNRDFKVLLYSTVSETEVYRRFLDQIFMNLSRNRETEFTGIVQHKIRSLARQCLGYLEIALKASTQADQDREELKSLILDEKVNYDLIRSEIFLLARDSKLQTRTLIAAHLGNNHQGLLTKRLMEKLKEALPSWKGNLWRLTRQYEEWLMETMTTEMDHISRTEYKQFFGSLKKAHSSISRSIELFRGLLDRNIEKVLGIRLSSLEWVVDVSEPAHPDVAFTKTFDFHFDLLWFLFPMFIFRGAFEKHFLKQIPRVVEIHLSRLAYQWEVRVNKTIDEIEEQALRYVRDELATIDAIVSKTVGDTEKICSMMLDLQKSVKMLES
ncbi:MAG TPA: dynamin family protein [Syntrophorhabdaceae bacterium]|nr:dynamin family protein [Syntrophorhabdaceae bacterium]HQM81163.1 dynamin family protein [Syntrophorhabdaceae bacterium]HQM82451.1 dynamin family protein [Syntrophorhabdaceae bacterium]